VGGQLHVPVVLSPGKTRYPWYGRLGDPQGWSGRVQKISSHTGIRSPDRPALSKSLYRLSYLAHRVKDVADINMQKLYLSFTKGNYL
jgi:hypothetical protein